MNASARSDRIGPTPARIPQPWSSPRSRTRRQPAGEGGTSNTNWVCTNSAPSSTLAASRSGAPEPGSTAPSRSPAAGRPPAGQQHALVAQRPGGPQQAARAEVEHRGRVGVVAAFGPVAGHQQQVGHPQRARREQVGLQRDPVAVPGGHLHHRLQTGGQRGHAAGQAGHPDLGALVVGDVGRVHPAAQHRGSVPDRGQVRAARRPDLGGDRELRGAQGRPES